MTPQLYDIIGDIHGYVAPLKTLLRQLGYEPKDNSFAHPEGRKIVFLGDFIDRGPAVREVLQIVHALVTSGNAFAVMGNHEFNAIAYHSPDGHGGHLRPHNDKNNHQHEATIRQLVQPHYDEWLHYIEWFRTQPICLDLGGIRAVHAAWDANAFALTKTIPRLDDHTVRQMVDRQSPLSCVKELLLNGLEISLPPGHYFEDKEHVKRAHIRTRWWMDFRGKTFRDAVFPSSSEVPELPIPDSCIPAEHHAYGESEPPVFVGHYWLKPTEPIAPQTPNVAVLDFSVAKNGFLTAYRWNGEQTLLSSNFVTVPSSE